MPRPPRVLQDGGLYHVMARGNNRQALFRHPDDFRAWQQFLQTYLARYPTALFHYCWMTNHVHLLLRVTHGPDLIKLMHGLLLGYARHIQQTYHAVGHVFQGRYRSLPILDESYLLECGRYIERNPLRARLVQRLEDYPYSSYRVYAFGRLDPLITEDPIYATLGPTAARCQSAYRQYLQANRPYEQLVDAHLAIR